MRLERRDGFTLIELMVAIAVFAVTTLGVTSTLLSSIRANRVSQETTRASDLAQAKLEELYNLPTEPAAGSDTQGVFQRAWTVTSNTPAPGMHRVGVTVTWRDLGNRSLSMQTILVK